MTFFIKKSGWHIWLSIFYRQMIFICFKSNIFWTNIRWWIFFPRFSIDYSEKMIWTLWRQRLFSKENDKDKEKRKGKKKEKIFSFLFVWRSAALRCCRVKLSNLERNLIVEKRTRRVIETNTHKHREKTQALVCPFTFDLQPVKTKENVLQFLAGFYL